MPLPAKKRNPACSRAQGEAQARWLDRQLNRPMWLDVSSALAEDSGPLGTRRRSTLAIGSPPASCRKEREDRASVASAYCHGKACWGRRRAPFSQQLLGRVAFRYLAPVAR